MLRKQVGRMIKEVHTQEAQQRTVKRTPGEGAASTSAQTRWQPLTGSKVTTLRVLPVAVVAGRTFQPNELAGSS